MINFRFKVDPRWTKRSWFDRFCARQTAKIIWKSEGETYQFFGWTGAKKEEFTAVNARKTELMHWILREAGYWVCEADVMERVGIDPALKE